MMNAPAPNVAVRRARPALPLVARIGAVLWPSFFAAGVATMVFFAIVDPVELSEMTWTNTPVSRELGYTIGFFMFWACTFSSSLFTMFLLSPARAPDETDDGS